MVYAGTFDPAFLEVPQECLILTMQQNQKYFALTDARGRMRARFLRRVEPRHRRIPRRSSPATSACCARGSPTRSSSSTRTASSELEARLPRLASVVYHQKLGTQAERVERLRAIARALAPALGADPALADRAARLAKADLVTDMVGEFPELQGTMGRYYAQHDGEDPAVAEAIAQHYRPRYAGDALPDAPVAQAVALADKLETLAGLFGLGQVPTGDKDPFGLRRAALGVLRVLVEKKPALPLADAIASAFAAFGAVPAVKPADAELEAFMLERLRGYLRELGGSANQVEAVLAARPAILASLPDRLAAVQAFEALPEAAALAAANKRIGNILKKSGAEAASSVDAARLAPGAEADLAAAFETPRPAGAREPGARRLRRRAEVARHHQADRRPLLRRGDGDGRRRGGARQPPRAAGARRGDDESRRRPLEALAGRTEASSGPGIGASAGRPALASAGGRPRSDLRAASRFLATVTPVVQFANETALHHPFRAARHPRPRRRDQPRQRPVHQVAGRVAARSPAASRRSRA